MINLKLKEKSTILFAPARRAYAFDAHTNALAEPPFWQRTKMGELVYEIKKFYFNQNVSVISGIAKLLATDAEFMDLIKDADVIIPVPPSKQREIQPTIALALELSKQYGVAARTDIVSAPVNSEEIKSMDIADRYLAEKNRISISDDETYKNKRVLLLDDVLGSGATLRAIIDAMIAAGYSDISALNLTIERTGVLE